MTDIIPKDESNKTSRVERFDSLNPGQFWRALSDSSDFNIEKGEILLLSSIDDIDGQMHTIYMRIHPSKWKSTSNTTARFLFNDFIDAFEHVDELTAKADRQNSMNLINIDMATAQVDLQKACSDLVMLDSFIERDSPKSESIAQLPVIRETISSDIVGAIKSQEVTALMGPELTESGVEVIKNAMSHHATVAESRSNWLQKQTGKFSEIASRLTPYIEEQAATAIALTKDMRDHVNKLMKGIDSLNLYTLKNVHLESICSGESAARDIKLTVLQAVLYMDEELAVYEDVDRTFDCRSRTEFFDALKKYPELVNQIFASDRCVVGMATTRRYVNYSDQGYSPIKAAELDKENFTVFLLVRDGENIHLVLSPELGHQRARCLFPSMDQVESNFRGFDGSKITYQDLGYGDCREKFDAMALTYKRLLILLCGLDHKKQIFGDFYDGEPSLKFVSLDFQEEYFNFIHDSDGSGLIATDRPPQFSSWLTEINSHVTSGSRVIVNWERTFSPRNIPVAFERLSNHHSRDYEQEQRYSPVSVRQDDAGMTKDYISGVVRSSGDQLTLLVPLSGKNVSGKQMSLNGVLNVSSLVNRHYGDFNFICLDRVKPDDVNWYLHDRKSRELNVGGIRLLKSIIRRTTKDRVDEQPIRGALLSALLEGDVTNEEDGLKLIDEAIAVWRCSKNGKPLAEITGNNKELTKILNQLYELASDKGGVISQIKDKETKKGRTVIRIGLTSNGQYVSYSTPLKSELDDRLFPFTWIARTRYILSNKGPKPQASTFVKLEKTTPSESLIFERDDILEFIDNRVNPFKSRNEKLKVFESIEQSHAALSRIEKAVDDADVWHQLMIEYIGGRRDASVNYVAEQELFIPVGVGSYGDAYGFACLTARAIEVLACIAPDNMLGRLKEAYISIYESKEEHRAMFNDLCARVRSQSIGELLQVCIITNSSRPPKYIFGEHRANPLRRVDGKGYSLDAVMTAKTRHSYNRMVNSEINIASFVKYRFDDMFDLREPENYNPTIIISPNSQANSSGAIFELHDYTQGTADKFRASNRYRLSVFDTEDEAIRSQPNGKYFISLDGDEEEEEEVIRELRLSPCQDENAVIKALPRSSWVLTEIGRIKSTR